MAAAPATPSPTPTRRRRDSAPDGRTAPRPRPSLRVVDAPRRARRWAIVMVLTSLLGVAGITSLSAASAEAAFTVSELERETAELERVRGELAADVAELSSLERIRRIAEQELGMVPADDPRYIHAERSSRIPAGHQGSEVMAPARRERP